MTPSSPKSFALPPSALSVLSTSSSLSQSVLGAAPSATVCGKKRTTIFALSSDRFAVSEGNPSSEPEGCIKLASKPHLDLPNSSRLMVPEELRLLQQSLQHTMQQIMLQSNANMNARLEQLAQQLTDLDVSSPRLETMIEKVVHKVLTTDNFPFTLAPVLASQHVRPVLNQPNIHALVFTPIPANQDFSPHNAPALQIPRPKPLELPMFDISNFEDRRFKIELYFWYYQLRQEQMLLHVQYCFFDQAMRWFCRL